LFAESDIFVLPSRNEGFSNSLIQAMASGLPCIATRVGGNAEALEEGASGFLIDSEDHQALAERLMLLLRDPQMARRMGRRGRQAAAERFGMTAMLARLMDIYDELLEDRLAQ
jgi:glycosyltransferase involved in cell wall biosynthesis